jgi:hypothetical protein
MPDDKSIRRSMHWGFMVVNILMNTLVIYLLIQVIMGNANHNQPLLFWNTSGVITEDRIHDVESGSSNFDMRLKESNFNVQSSGVQLLIAGFRLLISGFCFLVSGCWRIITNFWFQVSGLGLLNSF